MRIGAGVAIRCAFSCIAAIVFIYQTSLLWSLAAIVILFMLGIGLTWRWRICLIVVFTVSLIAADYHFTVRSMVSKNQNSFIGHVKGLPVIDGDRLLFYLQLKDTEEQVYVRYKIRSIDEKHDLKQRVLPGSVCTFKGKLDRPRLPSNFYAFNFRKYLQRQGIFWVLSPKQTPTCQSVHLSLIQRLERWRYHSIQLVNVQVPNTVAGLVNALVFGYQKDLDPEILDAYRNFGLVHLLAVSGMHVSIIFGILYWALLRVGLVREHVIFLLLLILLPVYVVLTGAAPSILRAAIMFALVLMAQLGKRRIPIDNTIILTLFILLLTNPASLFNIGFQLSFLVTMALVLSSRIIEDRLQHPLTKTLAYTGIAQLISLPVIMYHFFQLSLFSYGLNLAFIPLLTFVALPLAILLVIFAPIPFLYHMVGNLLSVIMLWPHELLARLHPASFLFVFGQPKLWHLPIIAIILYGGMYVWECWVKKWVAVFPILVVIGLFISFVFQSIISPDGHITFLDVGQGDSTIIQLPHRQGNILIDAGGRVGYKKPKWKIRRDPFSVGEDIVVHELKGMGIKTVDLLILTHSDLDHAQGVEAVINELNVETVAMNKAIQRTDSIKALLKKLRAQNIRVLWLNTGDQWHIGSATFHVVAAYKQFNRDNNRSVVIKARIGRRVWLFTGDLESEGEEKLLHSSELIKADILKIGHHGSETSTTQPFLEAVEPQIAVISVGENNRYGHPDPAVISRLKAKGITIFRTDRYGAIRFSFKNNGWFKADVKLKEK